MTGRRVLLLLALAAPACGGPRMLRSADLELVCVDEGGGRPAITALAFVDGGARLAVGDYLGALAVRDWRAPESAPRPVPQAQPVKGEILAIGPGANAGAELVAVQRNGQPFQWGRLTGALVTDAGRFVGWSTLTRRLAAAGAGAAIGSDVDVVAVTSAGARLFVLEGRRPSSVALSCRDPATLAIVWQVDLGHPARALAADAATDRLVVADANGLEVRALVDGHLLHRIEAPECVPYALRDGRRVLLVQDETLAILDLADPPCIRPAFLAHRGGVTAVAVAPDGTTVATGGARGDLIVFRLLPVPNPGPNAVPSPGPSSRGAP